MIKKTFEITAYDSSEKVITFASLDALASCDWSKFLFGTMTMNGTTFPSITVHLDSHLHTEDGIDQFSYSYPLLMGNFYGLLTVSESESGLMEGSQSNSSVGFPATTCVFDNMGATTGTMNLYFES